MVLLRLINRSVLRASRTTIAHHQHVLPLVLPRSFLTWCNDGNPAAAGSMQKQKLALGPVVTDCQLLAFSTKAGRDKVLAKEELLRTLEEGETGASRPWVGGRAPELPSAPGLNVEGIGTVPLPLTYVYGEKLKRVAEQAPYGRGSETIIDKSVRDTFQIDPSKVRIENPAWNDALQLLIDRAVSELGVNPKCVRSELYKLLLYDTHGHFAKHRDSEKVNGMFATLIIQLPSIHSGGDVTVSHLGKFEKFDMGDAKDTPYSCQFLAHYADCEHSVNVITGGYRLVLIYSLCFTQSQQDMPTASLAMTNIEKVKSALEHLPEDDRIFLLPLSHKYTENSINNLGAAALKGRDRYWYGALMAAGEGEWNVKLVSVEGHEYETAESMEEFDIDNKGYNKALSEWDSPFSIKRNKAELDESIRKLACSDMRSFAEGGRLLCRKDDIWTIEYDYLEGGAFGNEGIEQVKSYQSYCLLAWSKTSEAVLIRRREKERIRLVESYFEFFSKFEDLEYGPIQEQLFARAREEKYSNMTMAEILSLPPEDIESFLDTVHYRMTDAMGFHWDGEEEVYLAVEEFWKRP